MTREHAVVGFLTVWILSFGGATSLGAVEGTDPRALLGPELTLLSRAEVQTELGLDPKQIQKIEALAAGFRSNAQRAAKGSADGSPEAAVAHLDEEVAAYNRELARLLTAAQRRRVREIQIQMVGNVALLEPPVRQRLGLGAAEAAKLDEVARENVAQVKELRRSLALGEISPKQFQHEVARLGRELDRRLGEAASEETRAKLAELGGKPFAALQR